MPPVVPSPDDPYQEAVLAISDDTAVDSNRGGASALQGWASQQLTELMMKLCRMWLVAGMSVGVPGVDPMRVVNGTLSQLFTAPCQPRSLTCGDFGAR